MPEKFEKKSLCSILGPYTGGSKSSSSDRLAPGSKSEVSDVHRHTRRSSNPAQVTSSGSGTEKAPSTRDQSMAASEALSPSQSSRP